MPFTRITIEQNRLLDQILTWQFSNRYHEAIEEYQTDLSYDESVLAALKETLGEDNWELFQANNGEDFDQNHQAEIDKSLVQYIDQYQSVLFSESAALFPDDELSLPNVFPWVGNCEGQDEA